jgi:hypothetical protein
MADNNWRPITLLAGGALGLVTGLAAAYMYVRTAEENNTEGKPVKLETGDAFTIGLATVALVRQISDLAVRPQPKRR